MFLVGLDLEFEIFSFMLVGLLLDDYSLVSYILIK